MTLPLLQLKALGIDDIMKFEWVSAPSSEAVIRALERLARSGMIGEDGRLTQIGAKVAELGVDISIASMLWKSKEMKCSEEILTIAAMVSVQVLAVSPHFCPSTDYMHPGCIHYTGRRCWCFGRIRATQIYRRRRGEFTSFSSMPYYIAPLGPPDSSQRFVGCTC